MKPHKKIRTKIEQARSRLMLEHPYLGSLAAGLAVEVNEDIASFLSDGERLQYNDDYFEAAGIDEIVFALANGAMHTLLHHPRRARGRERWLWQLATDYAINAMLVANGFTLADRAHHDPRFEGMYAEEIFARLKSEIIDEQITDDPSKEHTFDEQQRRNEKQLSETFKTQEHESERPRQEAEVEMQYDEALQKQLFEKYRRQGGLPKGLELLVPEYFSDRIDWRGILHRYIDSYAKSDFRFLPPNMKYLHRGVALPGLNSQLLRIVVAIDTSASVDRELLGLFFAEFQAIMEHYPSFEIELITADAKIRSHRTFLPGERLEYTVEGGGGTDFRPVFDYIETRLAPPGALLYFTDAMGIFPDHPPLYDTLWILPEAKEVPFGEVLILER